MLIAARVPAQRSQDLVQRAAPLLVDLCHDEDELTLAAGQGGGAGHCGCIQIVGIQIIAQTVFIL
jgi:hypothetical protein